MAPKFPNPEFLVGSGGSGTHGISSDSGSRCWRSRLVAWRRIAIHPEQQVIANLQHFKKHRDRVAQNVEAAAIVVYGFYAHFVHDKTESVGEHKYFGIKTPSLDTLTRKYQACRLPLECLKSALCVFEAEPEHGANQ